MKMTPCAKLTMRMMPKINVRPQAMKNRIAACESALRHCARMKPRKFIGLLLGASSAAADHVGRHSRKREPSCPRSARASTSQEETIVGATLVVARFDVKRAPTRGA